MSLSLPRFVLPVSSACVFGGMGYLVGMKVASTLEPDPAGQLLYMIFVALGAIAAAGWGAVLGVYLSRRIFSSESGDYRHLISIFAGFLVGFSVLIAVEPKLTSPWNLLLPKPVMAVMAGLGCAGLGLVLVQVLTRRRR